MIESEASAWPLAALQTDRMCSVTVVGGFHSPSIRLHDRFGREIPLADSASGITTLIPGSRYALSCEVANGDRCQVEEVELQFWEFPGVFGSSPVLISSARSAVNPGSTINVVCAKRVTAPAAGRHSVYGVKIVAGPFESKVPVEIDPDEITWSQAGVEGSTAMRSVAGYVVYRGKPFEWTIGPDLPITVTSSQVRISSTRLRDGEESVLPDSTMSFSIRDNAGSAITLLGVTPYDSLAGDQIIVKVEILEGQPFIGFSERLHVGIEPLCVG